MGRNKWGEETGEADLTLILSVGEGGVEIYFCLVGGGVRLNFEPYFINFLTHPSR